MKRPLFYLPIALALVMLLMLFAVSLASPQQAAAEPVFNHPWIFASSINVLANERGLWDDTPLGGLVAGPPGEAGLLWLLNNQILNETVVYKTTQVQVSTTSYRILTAKAAVSDFGDLMVGYALNSAAAPCVYQPALRWTGLHSNGSYWIKQFALPLGQNVMAICILVTDNPDNTATGRSSALIDYIRLQSTTGTIKWSEEFTGAP